MVYYVGGMPCVASDELYHHGIKGMRWGVRRYQNEDGSLTSAGKQRYYVGEGGQIKKRNFIDRNMQKGRDDVRNRKSMGHVTAKNVGRSIAKGALVGAVGGTAIGLALRAGNPALAKGAKAATLALALGVQVGENARRSGQNKEYDREIKEKIRNTTA